MSVQAPQAPPSSCRSSSGRSRQLVDFDAFELHQGRSVMAKKRSTKRRLTKPRATTSRSAKRPAASRRKATPRAARAAADRLADEAQLVFKGTVVQRGAVTMDEVPLPRDATVVRVDEILTGPPVLAGFAGREITVQLSRGQRVSPEKSFVFYT